MVPREWERFQPRICLIFQSGDEIVSTVPREWERFYPRICLTFQLGSAIESTVPRAFSPRSISLFD